MLIEPARLGALKLKNRVIMTPMGMFGIPDPDGTLSERGVRFYEERARGGTALVFPAAALVTTEFEAACAALNAFDGLDKSILWSRLAERVHHHGAKLGIQLSGGLGRASVNYFFDRSYVPVSASAVPAHWTPWLTCRPLEVNEIERIVEAFGAAAMLARGCGIDVIEIHGYGGYLLDQFMSSLWNLRDDEYGGGLEGRMKLPLEVLARTKEACGREVPVIFKMTPAHGIEGGRLPDEGLEIARMLEAAGADAIHVDAGCYEAWHRAIPPVYEPSAAQVELAALVKEAVSVPVITNGKLGDPEVAQRVLDEGKADFIGLGRPQLADPHWVSKVAEGRPADIVPCIGCCEGCLARGFSGRYASCAVNPSCGMEGLYELEPAPEPGRVLVIGGGPAGMTAAITAKRRGHEVLILEKRDRLGGNLVAASAPGFKRDVGRLLDYLRRQLDLLDIEVRLGTEAGALDVREARPAAVILATGARPIVPELPGVERENVTSALDVLNGEIPAKDRVLVAGAGVLGCETAVYLAGLGKRVTLIDGRGIPAGESFFVLNRASLVEMMERHDIEQLPGVDLAGIRDEGAIVGSQEGERLLECDSVVLALGFEQADNAGFLRDLPDGIDVRIVGDASEPRKVLDAVWEAFHASRLL